MDYLPKVNTQSEFLQFGGCCQIQPMTFIAKAECLGNPEKIQYNLSRKKQS